MSQHDMVREGEFNYYYLNVRKDSPNEFYAVLTTLSGDADLYYKY